MSGRRVSMADVAALAGVSGQTVSRVVNSSPRVDPDTRARVSQAMAELGYRPHAAARTLRTGRTRSIGVIVSTLATVGNSRMLEAVARAAAQRSLAVTVVTLESDGRPAIEDAFARLAVQNVDGAIVLNEASVLAREVPFPAGLEVVAVDSPVDSRVRVVESDHVAGAIAATTHLLSLGHPTVWHLAGPDDSYAAAARERGWRSALHDAGAPVPDVARGDWSSASGYEESATWVSRPDVTAVFAANDQMALGVLRRLSESGRGIPGDVSVVGFDDVPDAAQYRPPLTTVRQDFDELGERAVAALTTALAGGEVDRYVTVPARLVVRASSGGYRPER